MGSTVNIGTPSNNTVTSAILQNGSVVATKIATDAVTTAKIANDAVTTAKITDNAVTTAEIADEAVTLAKLPHGTSSNNGKFLRANNGADPTFESVITDLVNDTSPQLGGDLQSNCNNIHFADNDKAAFGSATNGDMVILHNGTDSIIDNQTGNLFLRSGSTHLQSATGENKIVAEADGAVELYHNNTKQFETTGDGAKLTSGSHFDFHDNSRVRLGDSSDLQLYHDGNHSHLTSSTGNLRILADGAGELVLTSKAGEEAIVCAQDGSVELMHDNSKKLETTSSGVTITGTCTATAFAGDGSALTGIQGIPSGVIMMWSGAVNAIPTGFVLCNGSNSTPDLRDRFVVGAGNSYSVGDNGGSVTATDTVSVSVSGSGTTGNQNWGSGSGQYQPTNGWQQSGHNHSFSFSGSGSDTVSIDTRSPYYALCYIMKT